MVDEIPQEDHPRSARSKTIHLKDPVVGAYAFFSKHLPVAAETDLRRDCIELLTRAQNRLALDQSGKARHVSAKELDLVEVDSSGPCREPLVNLFHQSSDLSHQALAFTFLDTLATQIFANQIGIFSLDKVHADVVRFLDDIIGPTLVSTSSKEGGWGGIFFLWGMVPHDTDFEAALSSTLSVFDDAPPTVARVEHGVIAAISSGGIEGFLLLTPDTPEAEGWAQKMLIEHTPSAPPPLLLLELARSKFDYEHRQYSETKLTLDKLSKEIDQRLDWLIHAQRANEQRLNVVGSQESIELLERLSRATTDYADFRRAVTRVGELRNTLRINFENYRVILKQVVHEGDPDQLFQTRVYRMEQIQDQLNYDSVYTEAVLERSQTILETAAMRIDLLRGSQEREEIAFQGIQTGALTAITIGLAMLQVFSPFLNADGSTRLLIWIITVTLMAGTFALSQVVINWKRVKTPVDRISVAVTMGLICLLVLTGGFLKWGTIADGNGNPRVGLSVAVSMLVFLAGTAAGYGLFRWIEARQRRG